MPTNNQPMAAGLHEAGPATHELITCEAGLAPLQPCFFFWLR
jgi:hypothetical protein